MAGTRRRLLKSLAATPVVLATGGLARGQSAPQRAEDSKLAVELRDAVRRHNGRVASFSVTFRDQDDALSESEDAGVFSRTVTLFNGHYYLDWTYDSSDVPILFKLRGPAHVITGPLVQGKPGRSHLERTEIWPSSPNAEEILPVPGVFSTVTDRQADRIGREAVTLAQGDRVYWIDPETLDVLQQQKLDSAGRPRLTVVFDDFRLVSGHHVPHEINAFVAGRPKPTRLTLSDVELWETPRYDLFDVKPYLHSVRPAGERKG